MREQVTFAVDATGCSHYVQLSKLMKHHLSIEEAGACIDEWPGDYPGDLEPGFYSASLEVTGSLDNPQLRWTKIQKMTSIHASTKVTKLPSYTEKEPTRRKRKTALDVNGPLQVRVRRKEEVQEIV